MNTCNNLCNTACTANQTAEIIAGLGANISLGHIVKAIDYTSLKQAMDKEYQRRNKAVPSGFETVPTANKPVLYNVVQKIMTDVYGFDNNSSHDWRNTFQPNDIADSGKWEPVIAYIKTLASQIVK